MRRLVICVAAVAVGLLGGVGADAARVKDYASTAYDVLVPGENGSPSFTKNTNDQAKLYDALTPLKGAVTASTLAHLFKPETFGGTGKPEDIGRSDVAVLRDKFGVAHVTGKTRAALMYADGWVTAEDRGLLMELMRYAGRLAVVDAPGYDAFSVLFSGRKFEPSPATEAVLAHESDLLRAAGARGKQALADVNSYLAGINGFFKAKGIPTQTWTANDVISIGAIIAARFGANGGREAANSQLLAQLQQQLGASGGAAAFSDLAESMDPEAPLSVPGSFPYDQRPASAPGSVVLAPGSFQPATKPALPAAPRSAMSNALLIGAKRSATGHPLFVAGPQVGYLFPEVLLEEDLHGGGIDARGVLVPGVPYVVMGRGADYAWSATSSQSDNIDTFAETLCGGDDHHYLFNGECRAMTQFDAGVLKGNQTTPDTPVSFWQTVHGPVFGYAMTTGGQRVALTTERSTRGREGLSLLGFQAYDDGSVRSPQTFFAAASQIEVVFNWFYADDKHIAVFSSGRLPMRAAGTDPELPTVGTGAYEWGGFLGTAGHPQGIDPANGMIVNWNNKLGGGFGASDDNWAYGSMQRVQMLESALPVGKITLPGLVGAMNTAATQDFRKRLVPLLAQVLAKGSAPSPRDAQLLQILQQWDGTRLDLNGDGKVDEPGAAIMDAFWPRLADSVLRGALGPATDRLAGLMAPDDSPGPGGSAYLMGWYGYVDKDLRSVLGQQVSGPFSTHFCGAGNAQACAVTLWAALDAAGNALAATQGPDPAAWRADASAERIHFAPGLLRDTMRWTNRPTFQQVISFSGHRP